MYKFLRSYWFLVLLTFLGITGGFLYWKFIGCNSGSCPITSNWQASSLAGGVMAYLAGSIFNDLGKKPPKV